MNDPYQTLELDSRASDIGLLRFWAAVVSIIAVIWLAAAGPPLWAWIAVLGGALVAFFWLRRWARTQAKLQSPHPSYLALQEDGFRIADAGEEVHFAWEAVQAVEADEGRVAVRVELADEDDALYVEPTWGGLGLYELEAAMRAAREASPSYQD